jgi:F-type H+-transporting ATPase subunit a
LNPLPSASHTNSFARRLVLLGLILGSGVSAFSAESGLSIKAEHLFKLGPLPVTNSMVMSWTIAIALVIVIRLAVRKPQLVPSRGQAIVEALVTGISDLTAPIVGSKVAKHAFPLLIALFVYILIQNWSGLLPGVGTIKVFEGGEWQELIRPAHADMNGTIALAAVSMVAWLYLILRYAGPKAVLFDLFGNKADRKEMPAVIYYFLFALFFFVGLVEVVSILFRPVSLSFRLFGNIFGGENLLHAMFGMQKWVLPVPFYFLELIIGFVQALVFTLLVSVYIGLICNHGDDHGHEDGTASEPGATGEH